jgi:GNAT superfamily N-acetyltransferase
MSQPLPSGVTLRRATLDDVERGADLQRDCWRETYGPHADPTLLETRLANRRRWVEAWQHQLEHGPPRTVAVAGDDLIGFAVAGPQRDDPPAAPTELYALYVRQAWWGSGVADPLLRAALAPGPCSLWVLEANARAQSFYRRHGFEADGAREHYADLDAWEVRMVRRAAPEPPGPDRT